MRDRVSPQEGERSAEEVKRQVEARLALGDFGIFDGTDPKTAPTLEDYADKWLKTYIAVRFKRATFFTYRASLQTHTLPILGKKTLDRIKPDDIEKFIYQLTTQAEPPAQKTIAFKI